MRKTLRIFSATILGGLSLCLFGCNNTTANDETGVYASLIGAMNASNVESAPASNSAVYYIGAQDDARKLAEHSLEVTVVDDAARKTLKETSGKTLIVDGAVTLDKEFIARVLQAGNAVVAINNPRSIQGILGGSRGQTDAYTVYGYFQSQSGPSASFRSDITDSAKAAVAGHDWAVRIMSKVITATTRSPHPAYDFAHQRDITLEGNPGLFSVMSVYYKLNESDPVDDFYVVELRSEAVPDQGAGVSGGSIWWFDTEFDADEYEADFELIEYSPTASTGGSSASVSLGDGVNYSYSLSGMTVENYSKRPTNPTRHGPSRSSG